MTITVSPSATRPVLDRVGPVSDQSGLTSSPGLVWTEDRTAVLPGPVRTAVSVLVLVYVVSPVRSSVLSPSKNSLRTGTGPDPATLMLGLGVSELPPWKAWARFCIGKVSALYAELDISKMCTLLS